jgi:hypothetical protein
MSIQDIMEGAISQLAEEFLREPYRFFTEADAVARFHQLLDDVPALNITFETADGHKTGLCHREYPTFFRFSDKNPTERLKSPASRGHYDTVILNPEFVTAHPAITVANRDISAPRDKSILPFRAVVEFKLDNIGWSAGRTRGAIVELGKLELTKESPLRYFVVLMRYSALTMTRWRKYWPIVRDAAEQSPQIGSLFAVHWLAHSRARKIYRFGQWAISDNG